MKLCLTGYIPPPTFPGATAFFENIRSFKTSYDLLLFSDHDWPDTIRLKASPEANYRVLRGGQLLLEKPYKFAINNVLWFTALKIAWTKGYSHTLYLEADCRVGRDHWDAKVFDEYFDLGRPLICGGTVACYNSANWSPKAHQRWEKLVVENAMRWQKKPYAECIKNVPIASYGWKGASDKSPACVFPNGALSILSLAWAHELFDLTQPAYALTGASKEPFDMRLGRLIWDKFEEDSYEVVGHLTCIYSGYGELVTTIEDRKQMLLAGKICAVHQIKGDWSP